MLSTSPNFFQTKRSLSEIKAELLPAFFNVWAKGAAAEELVLADLNAGNGTEAKGEKAPALTIQEAFQLAENGTENDLKTLKLFLNDPAKTNLEKLKQSLFIPEENDPQIPEGIYFLDNPETQETLSDLLPKVPGLIAADPFSSGLAQHFILKTLSVKVADLFLLFDYKKLEKTFLAETPIVFISQLFGEDLPEIKAKFLSEKSPKRREQFLLEQLAETFKIREFFSLLFRINAPGKGGGTTYLLLANSAKGTYLKAKEWLQTFSEMQEDNVPLFGVNLHYQPAAIPGFSSFLNKFSLANLTNELSTLKSQFHYQTIEQIYETHSPGTPYVRQNYLAAFQVLQKSEKVNLVDASNKKMLKVTPDAVVFYRLHSAGKAARK